MDTERRVKRLMATSHPSTLTPTLGLFKGQVPRRSSHEGVIATRKVGRSGIPSSPGSRQRMAPIPKLQVKEGSPAKCVSARLKRGWSDTLCIWLQELNKEKKKN